MRQDDDRNLFADESDIFKEERKKSGAGSGQELPYETQEEDSSSDEADPYFEEEKPASPVRRILLIAGSIVAGIALGVGGYLFFTAGNKITPAGKQVVKVLPDEPGAVPMPPALPSGKPNVIPEVPVKTEPPSSETAQAKEAKSQDPLPKPETKKEPLPNPAAEKPKKEAAPAAAVKSQEKQQLPSKPAAHKEAPVFAKGKGLYYVQAGVFESQDNANAVARKIRQKGFTPTIMKVTDDEKKILYRVTVGRYSSHNKAAKVSEALGRQGVKTIVKQ